MRTQSYVSYVIKQNECFKKENVKITRKAKVIRLEKEKITKKWKRHLEKMLFQMLKINMTLTSRNETGHCRHGKELKDTHIHTHTGKTQGTRVKQ